MRKALYILVVLIVLGWLYNKEVIPHERPAPLGSDVVQFDAVVTPGEIDIMAQLVIKEIARRVALEQGEGAFRRSFWSTATLDDYQIRHQLASQAVIDMVFVNETREAGKRYLRASFNKQQRQWRLVDLQM